MSNAPINRTLSGNDEAIGMQLAEQGRFAEALPYLQRAHARSPGNLNLLFTVAGALQLTGRLHEAVHAYEASASQRPDEVGLLVGWARALLMVDDDAAAVPLLDRALMLDPRIATREGTLRLLWRPDRKDAALHVLRTLTAKHPDNIDLLCQYAQMLRAAEYLEEAQAAWNRYLSLRPGDALGPVEAGRLAISRGDRLAARALFARALAIAPDDPAALAEYAQSTEEPLDAPTLIQLTARLGRERDPENLALLHDALAHHHERLGQFAQAATEVARMNAATARLLRPSERYDPALHAGEVAFASNAYTPALFRRLCQAGNHDRRPLFVVGLPRSGTTLLERMLAAHPDVVAIGEQTFARLGLLQALAASGGLPDNLTAMAVDAAAAWHLERLEDRLQRQGGHRQGQRIVDKLPDNYLFAGWIHIAFPEAIVVHTLRDPRAVAWSCWSTHFARIDWSLQMEHIAHRIEQHRLMMRHWRQVMPKQLVEVRYERLIADPERELRRLLAALGLDWDAGVMDFARHKGFVASASRHQVREGIHTRSIGRWRNYAFALAPILPRLEAIVAQDAQEATADLQL